LGVSEPEIQRSGSDQISIGLPAVKNANRAESQVGTTAQLQFYDWEPNLIGPNGKYLLPDPPNDSTLINSNPLIVGLLPAGEVGSANSGFVKGANDANSYYTGCQDLANDYEGAAPTTGPRARGPRVPFKATPKNTACAYTLKTLGNYGPPPGSTVVKVPQGI